MIELPRLTQKDVDNIMVMKKTAGWKIICETIEASIKLKNAALINFEWKFDDNGDPTKQSVISFKDLQKETGVLKSLLMFIAKPVIIQKNERKEVYE